MITNRLSYHLFISVLLFYISLNLGCKHYSKNETLSPEVNTKGVLFGKLLPTVSIDSFIEAERQVHKIPAVSLAIINNGEVAYFKNYGVVNVDSQEPIAQTAVFEAASITKPVFAYTVCRLAQKDIINLDSTLHERLPFPVDLIKKYPCYPDMTPRHVLTHVSGLANWGVDLKHCPGEKYGYSGQGFEFLTKALARSFTEVMDQRIMKYLNDEVLIPFEMTNTYFVESDELKMLCVDGHLEGKPSKQEFPESPEMAFGMHCNARDIAKFAIHMLNRTGLSEEMSETMFSIQTPVPEEEKEFQNSFEQGYGLGFYIRESPKGKVFGHSGSNYDFKCLFEVYEDLEMGYVIMTNSDTGDLLNDKMAEFLVEGFKK
ncbi:serine hydrolase domain-containing protein [Croceivirga thetidis]|uniref:Beta-lactamase family protein n=1 Tax=Croceivirga thetidis TaxID=2721623 RepID=A0ABX1GS52_9FLAO|nr:serine hydrolase domain-containing protein [Croceivirga thetidis]NKI32419.1 beta-lactamase family protein [Croceivirga thetidis]